MHWYGSAGDCKAMVMELLGPNLETILRQDKEPFSINTTAHIGIQMLKLIRHLHSKSFIHRDIKPDNFTIGLEEKKNTIYMIDFGLAKYYRDPKTKLHTPYRNNKNLIGTARYASINTHLGLDQTRRDDVEALFHVLIYFLKGGLPWQGYKGYPKREKYTKIMDCKLSTSIESLCRNLPRDIANLLYYARLLKYDEKPDYNYIHNLLLRLLPHKTLPYQLVFERPMTVILLLNGIEIRGIDRKQKEKFSCINAKEENKFHLPGFF